MKKELKLMKIEHLSVSRVGVWRLCQQQYKYKYHEKIPSLEEDPIYFTYGSIIHKIAEKYIEGKGQTLISEIAEDVLSGKIALDDNKKNIKLPQEYKSKVVDHIRAIKKISDQLGYDGYTEWEFNFDLEPPNKKIVTGYVDRLVQKGDKFWILDYKTTKKGPWRKSQKDITSDLQLRTYARVVQKEFDAKPENIKAALYYLEGPELVGASFSEQSLDRVEEELLKCYNEIAGTNPNGVLGNVGQHCSRCDYRKICPFYSLT
jgi:CRISPR/Cas system-associated exonuclease Cas4 (RecB family)